MNIVCLFIILCFIYFIYYNVFEVNVEGLGIGLNWDKMKEKIKAAKAAAEKRKAAKASKTTKKVGLAAILEKIKKRKAVGALGLVGSGVGFAAIREMMKKKKAIDGGVATDASKPFLTERRKNGDGPMVSHGFTNQYYLERACTNKRQRDLGKRPTIVTKVKSIISSKGNSSIEEYVSENGDTGTIQRDNGKFKASFTGNSLNKYCDLNIMKQIPKYEESTEDFKELLSQNGWGGGDSKCDDMKAELKAKCDSEQEDILKKFDEKENELEEKDNKLEEKVRELREKIRELNGTKEELYTLKDKWWCLFADNKIHKIKDEIKGRII